MPRGVENGTTGTWCTGSGHALATVRNTVTADRTSHTVFTSAGATGINLAQAVAGGGISPL
jgi:hypothetical protein